MAGTTESLDLGPVSAYAVAVANGYTGTEEQWTQAIANASVNGQNAVQAKLAAEEYAQQAEDAKTDAVAAAAHYPKVQNGFWYLWDNGQYVNTNIKAEGMDGVTFTPSVSAAGVLSWTNNGDLPNPEPVNIKGDPGQNTQIHICTASEYDAVSRVPTILEPDETVFYLVPAADGAGSDLYTEWFYANNAWEIFGTTRIDLSGYAEKTIIAPIENGTASKLYNVGKLFIYNNSLYKVTVEIPQGGTIAPDVNCDEVNIVNFFASKTEAEALLIKEKLLDEMVPDTTQAIAFDQTTGNVQSITHSSNGVAVRTDVYTFGTNTITEVRTLSTGQSLTIVTNTETLATTITYDDGQAA